MIFAHVGAVKNIKIVMGKDYKFILIFLFSSQ